MFACQVQLTTFIIIIIIFTTNGSKKILSLFPKPCIHNRRWNWHTFKWHCQSQTGSGGRAKIFNFPNFHMGWIPCLWTSFWYQKFWQEVLHLKINEDKPHLTIVPLSKEAKTTFGHYSKKLGPWPMILGHYTKWVRGSIWPIHNFYSLLLKKLRKLEKTVIF